MHENQEAERLGSLLILAAERFASIQGPIAARRDSGAEMAKFLLECSSAIAQGNITFSQKRGLMIIFAPTSDWDDFVGEPALANEIYSIITKLNW